MKAHQQTIPSGQWPAVTALPDVLPTSTLKPSFSDGPVARSRTTSSETRIQASASRMLGQMSAAVVIVDAMLNVKMANASARALTDGNPVLQICDGVLMPVDPAHKIELIGGLNSLDWSPDAPSVERFGLRLVNEKRGTTVIIVIRRFCSDVGMSMQASSRLFSMTLLQPNRVKKVDIELLRQIFDLSRAEAAIAAYLAQGYEPCQIAALREVSVETIRAQLRNVFSKTGTNRQADVVRVVSDLSVVDTPY